GEIMRHGPHQSAQKSTTTGTDAVVSSANVPSSASTTHGSACLHDAHRGWPLATAPTRLRVSQFGQRMIVAMTPPSSQDRFDLRRFVEAQDRGGTFDQALRELRAGR